MLTVAFVTGSFLFCFVIITFIQHQFRASRFGFGQNCCCYTFSVVDAEAWVEFCFNGLPYIATTTKIRQDLCDFIDKEQKKINIELVSVSGKLNEQIHIHSSCSSLKMEMTSLRHVSKWYCMRAIKEKLRGSLSEPDVLHKAH